MLVVNLPIFALHIYSFIYFYWTLFVAEPCWSGAEAARESRFGDGDYDVTLAIKFEKVNSISHSYFFAFAKEYTRGAQPFHYCRPQNIS